MKKEKENRIRILSTKSMDSATLSKNFLRSKKYIFLILKKNWENFLVTYQRSKKQMPFSSLLNFKGSNFFYFKKEKFYHYNYLILAKLMDFLGNTQSLQNKVRNFINLSSKHLELEKVFQIQVSKNRFFFCWFSYLLMQQMYQFIKTTSSFFWKSKMLRTFVRPLWKKKYNLEVFPSGNFMFFKCHDFLLLKWYQHKINAWRYHLLEKSKETQFLENFHNIVADTHNSIIHKKVDKLIHFPQNEDNSLRPWKLLASKITNRTHQKSKRKYFSNEKTQTLKQGAQLLKQKYLKLIKNIVQKSKILTQGKLIEILNKILENWDPFILNKISRKKYRNLNLILYQLLWRWGLARHRKQKAKWIKNRYWFL